MHTIIKREVKGGVIFKPYSPSTSKFVVYNKSARVRIGMRSMFENPALTHKRFAFM